MKTLDQIAPHFSDMYRCKYDTRAFGYTFHFSNGWTTSNFQTDISIYPKKVKDGLSYEGFFRTPHVEGSKDTRFELIVYDDGFYVKYGNKELCRCDNHDDIPVSVYIISHLYRNYRNFNHENRNKEYNLNGVKFKESINKIFSKEGIRKRKTKCFIKRDVNDFDICVPNKKRWQQNWFIYSLIDIGNGRWKVEKSSADISYFLYKNSPTIKCGNDGYFSNKRNAIKHVINLVNKKVLFYRSYVYNYVCIDGKYVTPDEAFNNQEWIDFDELTDSRLNMFKRMLEKYDEGDERAKNLLVIFPTSLFTDDKPYATKRVENFKKAKFSEIVDYIRGKNNESWLEFYTDRMSTRHWIDLCNGK